MDMKRERSYIKETFHFPDRTARSITSLLQAAEGLIRRSQLSPPLLKHTKLLIPLMTSFCTPLPDLSSQIQPIRCQHGSCVVTVVMATLALLHLPILIQSPSPRAPSLPPSLFLALGVYKAYPYMARSFREQLFRGRCCKQCSERLCQHCPVKAHRVS